MAALANQPEIPFWKLAVNDLFFDELQNFHLY